MTVILHITSWLQWQQATQAGCYRGDTLDSEGFIHCSTPAQLVKTANAFFGGRSGLVLLVIDIDLVQAEIRYEDAAGEKFPHIYGSLNLDAVTQVLDFRASPDGTFDLPQAITQFLQD